MQKVIHYLEYAKYHNGSIHEKIDMFKAHGLSDTEIKIVLVKLRSDELSMAYCNKTVEQLTNELKKKGI